MSKQTLVDELYVVPEVLSERIFGEIEEIPIPETEEDAMIAVGKLSAHLNNAVLMPLSGLDITELLLRVGQRSSTAIAAVLSGLEVISGGGGGKMTILSPTDGAVVPNYSEYACSGKGISAASCSVDGDAITLTQDGDTWSGYPSTPIPTGKHSATFSATFGDGSTVSETVTFETTANMELVATFPENETSYRPEEITEISATLSDDAAEANESLTAEVFGQVFTLAKSGVKYAVQVGEIYVDFVGLNLMTVKNAAGDVLGEISFMLTGKEGGD